MFDLEEELKKLPAKPGVYIMHDSHDAIIYVGKAISLKNRVRQYFQSSRGKSPKIQQMVANIAYFEYIVVDSEMEALVLECNLIKEHHPKYNTMLKDDKSYPYIKVTVNEPYPRVLYARRQKKDKSKYFGPYTSGYAVKETLDLLRKTYQYRNCNKQLTGEKAAERPCLYHHIGQCKAPCQGNVPTEEYRKNIDEILEFLGGNYGILTKKLTADMQAAAEQLEFEKAAEYLDVINSVNKLDLQLMASDTAGSNRDIIAFATAGDEAVVQVFFIREGKMIGREHFYLTGVQNEERADIMMNFIKQYYAGTPYIPRELLLGTPLLAEDEELIVRWLSEKRGGKVKILVPQRGEKERMIELAEKNASMVLQQDAEKIKREEAKTTGAMRQIAAWLGMPEIYRIESYDISNTSGFESVGSMVVYENGRPKKNDYRKFKIRTVVGPDDYASMREVLTRRFLHGMNAQGAGEGRTKQETALDSFHRFPDLIMMDGGRGQVNVCLEVLAELGVADVKVCGMVKDDHHRTRGLYYNNVEIPIDTGSEAFKLITRIQDETHRFAIEYHRSLRGKAQVHSILDDIPGIGAVRRRALMKHYQSLDALKAAEEEDIAGLPEFNRRAARQVYEFFHAKGGEKESREKEDSGKGC
ncbi:MAG: excinuclease ABC subunit UvrC [Lachnospiraceae bacterium]|nr:excinuclease ABC subunit UvrC [Lachnospiraceae bacterium]